MVGRIHASREHRLTQISWYWRSDTKGARKQSRVFPTGTTVTIGRGRDQSIILDDDGVSRNHARLEITDGKVLFEDLGSTNGSLLNGTQRIKRIDWRPGQRIRVGNFMLEVAFEASDTTIIGPVRGPLGHVAGMSRSGPERQPVLARRIPATQASLDLRGGDQAGQPRKGNGTLVDEGQDAARPVDVGAAQDEVASPQEPLQHPLEMPLSVDEIPSGAMPSA